MKHNQMRQVVFPILAAFIWGTAFVAQDMCADAIGAFTFNATRYSIAVLALLVVILIRDGVKKDKPVLSAEEKKAANRQLWIGGLCCGAALAIASNFQQAGLVAGTDAGKAGFITALYVVLVPVFGLFFKRKVSVPTWIAVVLSVAALYLLCIKGDFSLAPGDLLLLVCALCFAVHILVIDHFTAYCDGVKLSCLQFLFAGTWSTLLALFFDTISFQVLLDCIWPLLYVGVFSCGVGYTLQILAQKDSNPTVVTILLSLESVFAVIAGAIILKQQMSVREYIGCVVMFAAFLTFNVYGENSLMNDFMCLYCYIVFGIMTLIQVMAIEGNYIDGLMVRKESIYNMLRAKYYLQCIFLLIPFLLCLVPVIKGSMPLLMSLSYLFFAMGPVFACLMQMAVYNDRTMPLNVSMIGKRQNNNKYQSIVSIAAMTVPLLINRVLTALFEPDTAYIIMILLGLAGFLTHRYWIYNIYKRFMKRRYQNMENFRNTR